MNVADISVRPPAERRLVGIVYPNRLRVMHDAVRIYRELGIAVDVADDRLTLLVPEAAAQFFAGMLERFTGRIAFNQWLEKGSQVA